MTGAVMLLAAVAGFVAGWFVRAARLDPLMYSHTPTRR